MEKMNNEGPGLIRGESTFLITETQQKWQPLGIMVKSPETTKGHMKFDVQEARKKEKETRQWHHQSSRLNTVESFRIGEVSLHLSKQVCYSNRNAT